jgi:hypothetical protein
MTAERFRQLAEQLAGKGFSIVRNHDGTYTIIEEGTWIEQLDEVKEGFSLVRHGDGTYTSVEETWIEQLDDLDKVERWVAVLMAER